MKHDIKRRFAFIETAAWWGDGLTAQMLGEAFGIARQNAQQSIQAYRLRYPGNLHYDPRRRRQVASDHFVFHYVQDKARRFLDYLRGLNLVAHFQDEPETMDIPFVDLELSLSHRYHNEVVRAVLSALRNRQAIPVLYRGRKRRGWLVLSPHHLVHADGRYHLRAYCHQHTKSGDFVLSRMEDYGPLNGDEWVSDEGDREWCERVDVTYRINPALPEETQALLRYEYGTDSDDCLHITGIRKALLRYLERRMTRIDPLLKQPLWILRKEHWKDPDAL